jgi:hypothetical protein
METEMDLRFMNDANDSAIDDGTGVVIRRQGRADVGEMSLRILAPDVVVDKPHKNPTFPARFINKNALADGTTAPGKKFEVVGYSLSEGEMRSTLLKYTRGSEDKFQYIKSLVSRYLSMQFARYHPGEQVRVEFVR